MIKFTVVVGFILLVVPVLAIMLGIVIYTDARAKEVDLETNED